MWTGACKAPSRGDEATKPGRKTLSSVPTAASVSRATVLRVTGAHEWLGEAVSLGLINLEGSLGGGEREGGFQELLA